jgi:(S)-2-hydroxyglutarate dehydrogenase
MIGKADITIVGAGIVGLATALKLKEAQPNLNIQILEKESDVAQHQTGHNSGVIHSGIYYKPGSLKALNCKKGYDLLLDFCNKNEVAYDLCGKVIVATNAQQKQALNNIYKRGEENGLAGIRKISSAEVKEIEPYVNCTEGVWVPQTGIISYTDVSKKIQTLFQEKGGQVFFNNKVKDVKANPSGYTIETDKQTFDTKMLINCAGLYSDKIAKLTNKQIDVKIIPFRGEYYELNKDKEYLVKNLIYPVPNPDFPFLGVHFTRMIGGGIEAGPNAVLAFKREGYSRWQINFSELIETVTYKGFRKIATKYWDEGVMEMRRSFSKTLFVKALQELIPDIQYNDVHRAGAGVRAQACDREGRLLDDFSIIESKNIINVLNAPSPAATSSLAIGEHIAQRALKQLS